MSDILVPPPLPPDPNASARAQQAAKAGIAAPVIFFLFAAAVGSYGKEHADSQIVSQLLGVAGFFILVFGTGASIYALNATSRYGREGLLGRAITGILLNGVLIAFIVIGGITGFRNAAKNREMAKQQIKEMTSNLKDIREDMRKDIQENDGQTSAKDHLKRMETEFERAGRNLSGVDKQLMELNAAFAKKMSGEAAKYESAASAFREAAVLAPSSNSSREKIAQNRKATEDFMAANKTFAKFLREADKEYESILQGMKIPPNAAKQVMAGFRKTFVAQQPILAEIRQCDTELATAALGILDVFDTHWGKWSVQQETGKVILPDDQAVETYRKHLAAVDDAADRQAAAQQKLLALKY
jgi:hypothetical protein